MKRRTRIKLYKSRKIFKTNWKRSQETIYKNYFGSGKKQKGRGVFGKLLKTFAAPILDILPI